MVRTNTRVCLKGVINSNWSTLINNNKEEVENSIKRTADAGPTSAKLSAKSPAPASSSSSAENHVIDFSRLLVVQRLMANSFKISLSLRKKETDEAVHFKQDGKRFEKELTVKLNKNTEYLANVTIRPETKLLGLVIQGEKYEYEEVKKSGKTTDEDFSVYSFVFDTTGYETKAKEKRKNIAFTFELPMGVFMRAEVQCKFYSEGEQDHSKWGTPLTSVDYDCRVEEGGIHVDIVKEKYL